MPSSHLLPPIRSVLTLLARAAISLSFRVRQSPQNRAQPLPGAPLFRNSNTVLLVLSAASLCFVGLARADEPTSQPKPAIPAKPALPTPPLPIDGGGPAAVPNIMPEPIPLNVLQPDRSPDLTTPSTLPSLDGSKDEPGKKTTSAETAPSRTIFPEFFGDQAPIGSLLTWPRYQANGGQQLYVPSARYFKISDNDSPLPQDRAYFSFNYFYNLNGQVNALAGGGIQRTRIHREIFGVELADKDNTGSIGFRLPINTLNAVNTVPGFDGATTDIGDLTIILKDVYWHDPESRNLISGGLAITPPTGPGSFAGSSNIEVFHRVTLQPFVGSIWSFGDCYVQHFTAVDAPLDLNDVVMLSNDFAIGYFLYQKHEGHGLRAVVPTVEVHVNTPLNHRGVLGLTDPAGNPDLVDITSGIHFEFNDHSSVGVAFAMPVSGPRVFDFEILAQLRWRY